MMARTRVLIADDHPSVRQHVSEMLQADYEIVGAVSDGLAAVDAAVVLRPDVVVLDISMPILNGLEAAARLCEGGSPPRIVFLTVHQDADFLDAARSVGAHGYVVKRTMNADLLPAIKLVLAGGTAFPLPAAVD
jgi:DNA-binding NarL/FixJ family response regulator